MTGRCQHNYSIPQHDGFCFWHFWNCACDIGLYNFGLNPMQILLSSI